MKKMLFVFTLLLLLHVNLYSQSINKTELLQYYYETFQYQKVIEKSDSLIASEDSINEKALLDIYVLKAASYFTLGEMPDSRKTFVDILKIDSNYELDNAQFSPKLQEYFNNIKSEFQDILELKNDSQNKFSPGAVINSLLLPGLGHFDSNNNTKGWTLTIISSLTLGSMIYFIADTYSKEEKYLKERDPILLGSAYDKYNKSYQIRNSLIFAYVAIWLYSQIDMLFFSNDTNSFELSTSKFNNLYSISNNKFEISFSLSF